MDFVDFQMIPPGNELGSDETEKVNQSQDSLFTTFSMIRPGFHYTTMPRPRHKNEAIIRLNSHPSHQSLCFDSKLVVVVVVIGLMETRLKRLTFYLIVPILKPKKVITSNN